MLKTVVLPTRSQPTDELQALIVAVINTFVTKVGIRYGEDQVRDGLSKSKAKTDQFLQLTGSLTNGIRMQRGTRIRLYEMLLGMMADACTVDGVGLTFKNLFERTGRLSLMIDDAFPGYVESGLFPMVISQLG